MTAIQLRLEYQPPKGASMKSQVNRVVLKVISGLLTDAMRAFPELKGSFLKDKERIALTLGHRGLGLFTLDLPHLDALLLSALERGRLVLTGPLSTAVSKRIQVPRLFSGLWLRVFHKDSCLKSDPDINAIAFLRQLTRLGKNLVVDCSRGRVKSTVEGYHNVEENLRTPDLDWSGDEIDLCKAASLGLDDLDRCDRTISLPDLFRPLQDGRGWECAVTGMRDRVLLQQCQQVADLVIGSFPELLPLQYSMELQDAGEGIGFKHGPGAVAAGQKGHDKCLFPDWSAKLDRVFPFIHSGKMPSEERAPPRNHEVPSRLICVPKSAKSPRLIAAEPVEHQWCQQLLWSWIRREVDSGICRHFLNFRRQELSAELVLSASRDRKLATVDLSDASDRLSCWTVERVFRSKPSILRALHAARTRWLVDRISTNHGLFIKLKKFASQGTATTFPVQSLVFLVIALASAIGDSPVTLEAVRRLRGKVRVYGDDIIIPTHGYARLVRLMELLQLKVNVAKSYKDGHFRESCGTDGYRGYDVTPVSPKILTCDGPASIQAVIDTINNLFYKGYWHASDSLRTTLPPHVQRGLRIVGPLEDGQVGLASFVGSHEAHLKTRWNPGLHRHEVRTWQSMPRTITRDRQGYANLLLFSARAFSPHNPRITSEEGAYRQAAKAGLRWVPTIA